MVRPLHDLCHTSRESGECHGRGDVPERKGYASITVKRILLPICSGFKADKSEFRLHVSDRLPAFREVSGFAGHQERWASGAEGRWLWTRESQVCQPRWSRSHLSFGEPVKGARPRAFGCSTRPGLQGPLTRMAPSRAGRQPSLTLQASTCPGSRLPKDTFSSDHHAWVRGSSTRTLGFFRYQEALETFQNFWEKLWGCFQVWGHMAVLRLGHLRSSLTWVCVPLGPCPLSVSHFLSLPRPAGFTVRVPDSDRRPLSPKVGARCPRTWELSPWPREDARPPSTCPAVPRTCQ